MMEETHSQYSDKVIVSISDPVMRDGGKYVVYTIFGSDKDGTFEMFRRYSDFDILRASLVNRWPGCVIPPLPSKKTLGNKEAKFLEDRKIFLFQFLTKLSELPYLWYSPETNTFLRNTSGEYEKVISTTSKPSSDDIITQFKDAFNHLAGKEINSDLNIKISTFKSFLAKAAANLEKVKNFCRSLAELRERYDSQFNLVSTKILPEYEQSCQLEYSQQNAEQLVFQKEQPIKDLVTEIENLNQENDFEQLVNMIRFELKEVQAFQEALRQRDMIEEKRDSASNKIKTEQADQLKLQSGKSTFKSLFQKGTKEDKVQKLEQSITETQHQLENYSLLVDLITVVIGYVEIDKFKQDKQQKYYSIMQMVSKTQYNLNQKNSALWNSVKFASTLIQKEEQQH